MIELLIIKIVFIYIIGASVSLKYIWSEKEVFPEVTIGDVILTILFWWIVWITIGVSKISELLSINLRR